LDRIRFGDLSREVDEIRPSLTAAVDRVLDSGWFVLGQEGERFEAEFAAWLGVGHVVGCANGTDAITLALKALGIGSDDEVITAANTCVPTATGIRDAGCELRVVDCDPSTLQIDPIALERAITPRTRCVIPVHMYGTSPDLDRILEICDSAGVPVIEDCAQAHGTVWKGRKAGTWGKLSTWSFYPSKNLGAYGDGGAVATDDEELSERLRRLRNYGQRVRYYHDEEGRNSRLDEIQAAILRVKLTRLDGWNQQRQEIASRYELLLADCSAIEIPVVPDGSRSSRHLFPVRIVGLNRDHVRQQLLDRGIETQIHYPVPLHRQRAYADSLPAVSYPVAERVADQLLSLPLYPQLREAEVDRVAEELRNIVAGAATA
jgi:dTDP-4-amino-4,6-dideoxygalactose transaminase